LELGNHREADAELDHITPELRAHPDVLEVRYIIYGKAEKWDACKDLARAITVKAPERANGWINLAFATRKADRDNVNGAWEAWDILAPVEKEFPDEPLIRYSLACYACQLGGLEEAVDLLEKCFKIENSGKFKLMALSEPDLQPLWKKISEIKPRSD
jgi:predicted Zn-dependent protease